MHVTQPNKADEYRQSAQHNRKVARFVTVKDVREHLLAEARHFDVLAEAEDGKSRTPERSSRVREATPVSAELAL